MVPWVSLQCVRVVFLDHTHLLCISVHYSLIISNFDNLNEIANKFVYEKVGNYSKACVKQPLSKRPEKCFLDQLSLNAGQKHCRMLQG